MKRVLSLATISILSLGFTGCGSGNTDTTTTNIGTFVDVPTKNLKYRTQSITGYTDENGKYKYASREKVKFYLGNIYLGEVTGGEIITPYTLSGDTNYSSPNQKTKNIARILQSLDTNRTDQDRIFLPDSVKSMTLDINISNATEGDLNSIMSAVNSSNTLIDENNASNQMRVYVENILDTPQDKITLSLLKQNPWYVIEYNSNGTYCNGKFTYNDTDLQMEYIEENGNNISVNLRYTLLNGKLISKHDGKIETEVLNGSTNTYIDINKTAIDATNGSFRNSMSKRWFVNRQDAIDFANSKGKDCSGEF